MTEVSAISTICKNCLFAIYDDDTQIGCHFGRTDKVDNHDVYELIEAEDEDKKFYILNNHICPYQRTQTWKHADNKDIAAVAMDEVYMPWAAMLFYRHNGLDAVEERIKEIKSQKRLPKVVVLVIDAQDITNEDFRSLHQMMEDNFDIWYLQRVIQKELPDRFTGDLCFDKIKKHRFMFYSYFDSTKEINVDHYERVHKYVIDDMKNYGIIKHKNDDNDIHHVTTSKITHLKYGGNGNGVPIEYKIAYENKDLTWMDISNKKASDETLEDKFIVDYDEL